MPNFKFFGFQGIYPSVNAPLPMGLVEAQKKVEHAIITLGLEKDAVLTLVLSGIHCVKMCGDIVEKIPALPYIEIFSSDLFNLPNIIRELKLQDLHVDVEIPQLNTFIPAEKMTSEHVLDISG